MTLTPDEREVVVTYNDADRTWHVYSDSSTMRGAVLRLARQVGAEVRRVEDHGVEFDCPADTLKLAAKRRLRLSAEQRASYAARLRRQPVLQGSAGPKATLETP